MLGVGGNVSLDAQQVGENIVLGVYAAAVKALLGQSFKPEIKIFVPVLTTEFAGSDFGQSGV